ncbi:hypothetical protein TCDM_10239 [Trypanosoma cruzi Dm28c]|uniref:Uncharacterized protein n=1 Tax=Trypanosoma cruzi Dm28c TaxID=1416333 RepID=V5D3T8_TRYCR|nr:hypothetical protein TCDM_10239 [Trypanosoma cruzi Dm28c]
MNLIRMDPSYPQSLAASNCIYVYINHPLAIVVARSPYSGSIHIYLLLIYYLRSGRPWGPAATRPHRRKKGIKRVLGWHGKIKTNIIWPLSAPCPYKVAFFPKDSYGRKYHTECIHLSGYTHTLINLASSPAIILFTHSYKKTRTGAGTAKRRERNISAHPMENTSPTSLHHWPLASWVRHFSIHSVPASVQFPAQQYYTSHGAASAQSHLAANHRDAPPTAVASNLESPRTLFRPTVCREKTPLSRSSRPPQ